MPINYINGLFQVVTNYVHCLTLAIRAEHLLILLDSIVKGPL